MTLLGEVGGDPPTSLATTLELTYRDTPASVDIGTGVQREVRVTVGPGRETSRSLKTWFDGSKDSDGIARSHETAFGTYWRRLPTALRVGRRGQDAEHRGRAPCHQ